MGIQKDAGEILALIYKKYTDFGSSNTFILGNRDIEEETKWDKDRILRAIFYLKDSNLAGISFITTSGYNIYRPTPEGISIIEDKDKFKRTFNFEVGVPGLFSFSWGASER